MSAAAEWMLLRTLGACPAAQVVLLLTLNDTLLLLF
jgi:hypothetical protein